TQIKKADSDMQRLCLAFFVVIAVASVAAQQDDPVTGNWRGTLKSSAGTESPFVLTIVKRGDVYTGTMSGLGGTSEIPLKAVTVAPGRVKVESADESKLGQVVLTGDLAVERASMRGNGTLAVGTQRFEVSIDLTR